MNLLPTVVCCCWSGMSVTFVCLILLAGMIWVFKAVDERVNKWRIRRYAAQVDATPDREMK